MGLVGVRSYATSVAFRILFIFAGLFLSLPAWAYKEPKWYTVKRLEKALRILEHLEPRFYFPPLQDRRFRYLENFPFQEVQSEMTKLVEKACKESIERKKDDGENLKSILLAIAVLSQISTQDDLRRLQAFFEEQLNVMAQIRPFFAERIQSHWNSARQLIASRRGSLPSLAENIRLVRRGRSLQPLPQNALVQGEAGVDRFLQRVATGKQVAEVLPSESIAEFEQRLRATLEERVAEQPEVTETLIDMMVRRRMYGPARSTADSVVFMGLPGNGKDTAAEALVDAVYGRKDAHKTELHAIKVCQTAREAWGVMGSTTGYVGSTTLAPLIRYLVEHSGGRYLIKSRHMGSTEEEYVVENPDWRPGMCLDGYEPPWKAFIFVNEFHNWAKEAKDIVLKEPLEKGIWRLNNPGAGVDHLEVPVNFIVATNDGIDLMAARETSGAPVGNPLPYDQLLRNWERRRHKKDLLKRKLTANASAARAQAETARGTSEEVVNRFPKSRLLLFKPLSPAGLRKIVRIKLQDFVDRLKGSADGFPNLNLKFTDSLVEFIQAYRYNPEENARPINDKVENILERTFIRGVRDGKVQAADKEALTLTLDIVKKEDGTAELVVIREASGTTPASKVFLPIEVTEGDRKRQPLSDGRIQEILRLEDDLQKDMIGSETVIRQLTRAVLMAEDQAQAVDDPIAPRNKAQIIALFGPTSVGKTRMIRQAVRRLTGNNDNLLSIDFNHIGSRADVEAQITGSVDPGNGEVRPSALMKHHDKWDGNAWVLLDEFTNANQEATACLYEIFREPVVHTFADREPRAMGPTKFCITGNAGEEWYKDIPTNIPWIEQQLAREDVFAQATRNPEYLHNFLKRFLKEALIARIGMRRIFFIGPLTFKNIRELFQMKIVEMQNNLHPREGARGWFLHFRTREDYLKILEDFEEHGYSIKEQGASIERFIQEFEDELRLILMSNLVPSESEISIESNGERVDPQTGRTILQYKVFVDRAKPPLALELKGRIKTPSAKIRNVDRLLVGLHEAGHYIVRLVLFGEKYRAKRVTIIPGVANIDEHWIRYLGLAESERLVDFQLTRQAIINEIAVLLAGEAAQIIATVGGVHDAGKNNDIERATQLAEIAILKFGLSEKWGRQAAPSNIKLEDYIAQLSEDRRELLHKEVEAFLNEGRLLALAVVKKHFHNAILPLGYLVTEKGDLRETELAQFSEQTGTLAAPNREEILSLTSGITSKPPESVNEVDAQLVEGINMPDTIADVSAMAEAVRKRQVAEVKISDKISFKEPAHLLKERPLKTSACTAVLTEIAPPPATDDATSASKT